LVICNVTMRSTFIVSLLSYVVTYNFPLVLSQTSGLVVFSTTDSRTDNVPIDSKRNNTIESSFSSIMGGRDNAILTVSAFSAIKGGTNNTIKGTEASMSGMGNTINEPFRSGSTVGGLSNVVQNNRGTNVIAGGSMNSNDNFFVSPTNLGAAESGKVNKYNGNTVSGGLLGRIHAGSKNTVVGGFNSFIGKANGPVSEAVVGGGDGNFAGRDLATAPGGKGNLATGKRSIAMGYGAHNDGKNSMFVNLTGEARKISTEEAFTVNANRIIFEVGQRRIRIDEKSIDRLKAFLNPDGSSQELESFELETAP